MQLAIFPFLWVALSGQKAHAFRCFPHGHGSFGPLLGLVKGKPKGNPISRTSNVKLLLIPRNIMGQQPVFKLEFEGSTPI